MKVTLTEPAYLKDSIGIISDLVTESHFKVTKDGIELVAMDPANVAMVVFKLLSSCFTEYDVPKDVTLALDLGNLKQILRRANATDLITLELIESKLKVTLKGKSTRTFSIPLLDVEEKEQKVPELNFPVTIKTPSHVFSDAIEDIDIVAESVSFQAGKQNFSVIGESDLSQANVDILPDEQTTIVVDSDDTIKSKYSVEYLKKMLAASKLSDTVSIQFNKDYPLRLDYTVVDKIQLSFILAPRVENE